MAPFQYSWLDKVGTFQLPLTPRGAQQVFAQQAPACNTRSGCEAWPLQQGREWLIILGIQACGIGMRDAGWGWVELRAGR